MGSFQALITLESFKVRPSDGALIAEIGSCSLTDLSGILHHDMPITKSAIKKQRVDKRRTLSNMAAKGRLKTTIKEARAKAGTESIKALFSAMDLAVKHHLVTKGHASRLKSRISKIGKKK